MKLFSVIPNPFTLLDDSGMPAGFTFSDPFHWGQNRRFDVVGGHLVKKVVPFDDGAPEDAREAKVAVSARVSLKVTKVVASEFHKARILSGEMIAADKETATECGITEFKDAAVLLAAERDARVAEWMAEHGGEKPQCARLLFEMVGAGDSLAVKLTDPQALPVAAPALPKKSAPVAPAKKVAAKPAAPATPPAAATPVAPSR